MPSSPRCSSTCRHPPPRPRPSPCWRRARTQEEQLDYARDLRLLKAGWTPELHKAFFSWFAKAAAFKGGNSFPGFMKNIRRDAEANLSAAEKAELKPILEARPAPTAPSAAGPERKFVKKWSLDELVPMVESGLKGRDYDHGREMFGAAKCFSCHRFNNEGGGAGPDLSGVAGRFSARDLLESVVVPSKTISDQYQAVVIATTNGKIVTGRIVNLNGNNLIDLPRHARPGPLDQRPSRRDRRDEALAGLPDARWPARHPES